ncbi:calcium-binding protein [Brevibacterium sp. CCUG 69071]|nr:calcium-binding protein [Brevibacterium sp. CCUG 69071]
MLLALIAVLGLVLLAGCAEGGEVAASDRDVSWTAADPTPAKETTADASPAANSEEDEEKPEDSEQGRAGGSTAGTAMAMLDELEVKGRAPKTGYDADLFKWRSDADHNGCDTRNDVLRRDLRDITLKSGTNGCVVIKGTLKDSYKGETYAFDRNPNNIDIDHIVARSNAWQTGGAKFEEDTLKEFGNDPLNLLAVSSSLNRQKGDGDAATWLPPNKSYRCEYVSRQIAVKHKYDLWVVKAEKAAMERVLANCEGEDAFAKYVAWPAPGDGDNVRTAKDTPAKKKASSSSGSSSSGSGSSSSGSGRKSSSAGSGSVYYENCTAAREAGAAPVRRGDPGYASHLDRDGDGVGCE